MSREEVELMEFTQDIRREIRNTPDLWEKTILDLQQDIYESAGSAANDVHCIQLGAKVCVLYIRLKNLNHQISPMKKQKSGTPST